MAKDNPSWVLSHFVRVLNIPVTRQTLNEELQKHPDYNTLLAFSDVLERLNVTNSAYKLTYDQLKEVPTPFIVHLANKDFGVISHFDDQRVVASTEKWNQKEFTPDEFKKKYGGYVLMAEKNERSGEADYATKRREEKINDLRLPVFLTGSAVLLIAFLLLHTGFVQSLNVPLALLTVFKTVGLVATVLLLIQSIDANNPLVQKLCGDDNKNCNAILSSKAAKITSHLNWSEVGFFYFAGTWLALLFNSGQSALLQTLAILNVLCLPYTVYSIYYQWRVAKQWCIFCCTVQAALWLEFFAFLPYLLQPFHGISVNEWSSLVIAMAAPVLFWIVAKPFFTQSSQLPELKKQLRIFKYNTDLFNKMMSEEVQYALPSDTDSLIIGNPEAEKVITMVANPYCQPCAKAHKGLQWMEGRDDVKLQVIFSTSTQPNDKKAVVAAHLLSLQQSQSGSTVKKAMHDWYEQKQKNYEAWANSYPTEISDTGQQLQKQRDWCKLTEIKGTPTLFLNGRRLPKNYQPEDLKYFI